MTDDMDKFFKERGVKMYGRKAVYIECDAGWNDLIKELVDNLIKIGWDKDLHQVKEKFGALRFYVGSATPEQFELIRCAEVASTKLCEVCGRIGYHHVGKGWYTTRCEDHKNG